MAVQATGAPAEEVVGMVAVKAVAAAAIVAAVAIAAAVAAMAARSKVVTVARNKPKATEASGRVLSDC